MITGQFSRRRIADGVRYRVQPIGRGLWTLPRFQAGYFATLSPVHAPHAATTEAPTRPSPSPQVSSEREYEQLDWKKAWYAVKPVADLDPDRPQSIVILGKNLVIWQDGEQNWRMFEDKCPHRLVALSEGRVEGGELMCSYHGWQFNGSGSCTKIPQVVGGEEKASRICSSSKAAVSSFPTEIKGGLLWVWMTPGGDAHLEALQTPIPCDVDLDTGSTTPWHCQDVAMSWEVLLENVTDPSHVPFSHHGVQGNRKKPSIPEFATIEQKGVTGYSTNGCWEDMGGNKVRRSVFLQAPGYSNIRIERADNPQDDPDAWSASSFTVRLVTNVVPVTATTSRIVFCLDLPKLSNKMVAFIFAVKPKWADHLERMAILDGDSIFLHRLSQDLITGKVRAKDYFAPASADLPSNAMWQFLERHCKSGVDYYPDASNEAAAQGYLPREAVLDRYNNHTKHCKFCSGALTNVRRGLVLLLATISVSVATLAFFLATGKPLLSVPAAACGVVTAVAAFAWEKLKGLEARFVYTDYIHAERN